MKIAQGRFQDYLKPSFIIGLIGMICVIYGSLVHGIMAEKIDFLVGATLMLIAAVMDRQLFLSILEVIVVVGTVIALTHYSNTIKTVVPLVISAVAVLYFAGRGQLKDLTMLIGCAGLVVLAVGFAIISHLVYFVGGVLLAVYGFCSFAHGVKIALLWGVLNALFAITALIGMFHTF